MVKESTRLKSSSQTHLDASSGGAGGVPVPLCNNLNSTSSMLDTLHSTLQVTADVVSHQSHQPLNKRSSMFTASHLTMSSSSSLAESSSCPLTSHHQYHYIQYPPYYHYIRQPAAATVATTATTTTPTMNNKHMQCLMQQQQDQQHQHHHLQQNQQQQFLINNCHCFCSCGVQQHQQQHQQQRLLTSTTTTTTSCHPHQDSIDSQMAVAVIVHQQSNSNANGDIVATQQSTEQSILKHSYQTLQLPSTDDATAAITEQTSSSSFNCNATMNISCDCDIECTCIKDENRNDNGNDDGDGPPSGACGGKAGGAGVHTADDDHNDNDDVDAIAQMDSDDAMTGVAQHQRQRQLRTKVKQCNIMIDAMMLGADDITVSESDNNSTMIKKHKTKIKKTKHIQKFENWCGHVHNCGIHCPMNVHSIDAYSDGEGDVDVDVENGIDPVDSCHKMSNINDITSDIEDHRPPLPPRPPLRPRIVAANGNAHRYGHGSNPGLKKYVVWCLICGGFSCLIGLLFLGIYFLLHSYTITVGNFETVPTFVPATLLLLTGMCVVSLARRKNRYSYLIKLSGACGLISALTCALVTVTTTVLHMSRLQALRECEYAQKTRTCTCYSDMIESQVDRVDKDTIPEGVRLVFDSLSDCGVVHGSLYSCLRAIFGLSVAGVLISVFCCMLVYQLLSHERKKMYWEQLELRCRSLYTSQHVPSVNSGATHGAAICRCCDQCHAHRQISLSASAYPWDDGGEPRFWTGQPPGNFYSPNPGGDDMHLTNTNPCRGHAASSGGRSRSSGWSWPRMPWQRHSPGSNSRFRQTPSSPDSQYGFSNNISGRGDVMNDESGQAVAAAVGGAGGQATIQSAPVQTAFTVVPPGPPYGVWGPPPPYSDPNSPARRGYYHYIQPTPCHAGAEPVQIERHIGNASIAISDQPMPAIVSHRSGQEEAMGMGMTSCCTQTAITHMMPKRQGPSNCGNGNGNGMGSGTGSGNGNGGSKPKAEYENTPSDTDSARNRDQFSITVPTTRKTKRRSEHSGLSLAQSQMQPPPPANNQQQHELNINNIQQPVFLNAAGGIVGVAGDANGNGNGNGRPQGHGKEFSCEATNAHHLTTDEITAQNLSAMVNSCPALKTNTKHSSRHRRSAKNTATTMTATTTATSCSAQAAQDNNNSMMQHSMMNEIHGLCDPSESEVYFADVSSCCNMSVKNDNYYEDTGAGQGPSTVIHGSHGSHVAHDSAPAPYNHHQHQHQHQGSSCSHSSHMSNNSSSNEDYLAQRFGQRENSIRSRLPLPQIRNDKYGENINQLQKEISRQSMCSVESEAKTEFTDLSPSTPCSNKFSLSHFNSVAAPVTGPPAVGANVASSNNNNGSKHRNPSSMDGTTVNDNLKVPRSNFTNPPTNFVDSFPYSSESQSLEAHRRSTKNIHDLMITSDAHYEVIHDAALPLSTSTSTSTSTCPFQAINNNNINNNNNNGGTSPSAAMTTSSMSTSTATLTAAGSVAASTRAHRHGPVLIQRSGNIPSKRNGYSGKALPASMSSSSTGKQKSKSRERLDGVINCPTGLDWFENTNDVSKVGSAVGGGGGGDGDRQCL